MNNQPAKLDKFTAFRENPFPVDIVLPDVFEIIEPVTVELRVYDVVQDVDIPVTVDGQTISFELTVEQLRLISEGYLYILFDGLYILGAPIGTTMDASIPSSRTISTDVPTIGIIRVSVYSDAYSAQVATEQSLLAKNYATQAASSKTAAELAKDAAELAAANAQLDFVPLGTWNAATNTPALTTDASAIPAGHGYEVGTDQGGNQSITGVPVDFVPTDKVVSNGTTWFLRKVSDEALNKVKAIEAVIAPNEYPDYVFLISAENKLLLGFDVNGALTVPNWKPQGVPKGAIGDFSVDYEEISDEAKGYMLKTIDPLTGYIWGVFDSNDRIIIACKTSGKVVIPNFDFTLEDNSVEMVKFDPAVQSLINAGGTVNLNNRMHTEVDSLIRSRMMAIGFRTSTYGSLFKRLPNHNTSGITFLNNSGTALEIRKATGLDFRGIKRIGNYDVPAITEGTYKGLATSTPSTSGLVAGDYFKIGVTPAAGTITINSQSYASGDICVWNGSAFTKKAAPSPTASSLIGHWWNVTTAGVFDGVTYAVGDIIYLLSIQGAGGPNYRHFSKNRTGEYFYGGEFTPGSFIAPTTAENIVFLASSSGTFDSKSFDKYDMVVRKSGAWSKALSQPVISVAAGEIFSQSCDKTGDFEIRRADTSDTVASIFIDAKSQFLPLTTTKDIVAYFDSFGGTLAGLAAALPERAVTVRSYGGAKSEEILSMQEFEILRSGDPFKGRLHIFGHGQNNTNVNQVIESAISMMMVAGVRDKHFLFLSVLGARTFSSHNGSRFVCALLENAFAGVASNFLVILENFYENYIPGNYLNMRKILLASAVGRTGKDITFPGMTEEQVAATYGITPISYHFNFDAAPFDRETINYLGTHSTTSAPTGGSDNDYYLSTHADHRGNWWVKISGTWTRFDPDTVHVQDNAKAIYVSSVTNWLTTNKL